MEHPKGLGLLRRQHYRLGARANLNKPHNREPPSKVPGEQKREELLANTYIVTHLVDNSHDGCRADVFIKSCLRRKSRAFIQRSIDEGTILLETREQGQTPRLKASTALKVGDIVKILLDRSRPEPVVDFNYKVLFEDDEILVIHKPGNLPVHPAGRFFFNTLLTHLRREVFDEYKKGKDFFLVHRIDRETSGVLLIAKQSLTARKLVAQFYDHEVEKKYLAIVMGKIEKDDFEVDSNIKSDAGSHVKLKMTTCGPEEGITARTRFKVLQRTEKFTLVEVSPQTGRQHQIRVHLASIGHPIVGDKLYGGFDRFFLTFLYDGTFNDEMRRHLHLPRHALHATSLKFKHPRSGETITIQSEMPQDMKDLLIT